MRSSILASLFIVSVAACGPKPEASPEAKAPESSSSSAKAPEAAPSETKPDSSAAAPAEAPKPDTGEKPSRPPIDTITAPKMAFAINYTSSEANEKAEKKCDKAAGKDMQVRAQCMANERKEFVADVLQFKADDKGQMWFITYKRKGASLLVVGRTPIEFKDETENTVVANIAGKDKVARVLFPMKQKFVIKVPNDYSIELDEPRLGKLVYDAKIDLLDK